MFESQLSYEQFDPLVPELLVHRDYQLQRDFAVLRVARIHTLLDLADQLVERECLLSSLLELILIFWKLADDLIHYHKAWYLMLEVNSVVLVDVRAGFQEEAYQEIAFNLVN